jgi:HIT domain-containing protein
MQDSIFTKIVKGEIPAHKLYEDERTLAFLDIYPSVRGQAVVIPKKQVEFVWDLDDADYLAVMETTKKIARRLREVLGTKYVGTKPHRTHPSNQTTPLLPNWPKNSPSDSLGYSHRKIHSKMSGRTFLRYSFVDFSCAVIE